MPPRNLLASLTLGTALCALSALSAAASSGGVCEKTVAEIAHADPAPGSAYEVLADDGRSPCHPQRVALARRMVELSPGESGESAVAGDGAPEDVSAFIGESLARGLLLGEALRARDTTGARRQLLRWSDRITDFLRTHPVIDDATPSPRSLGDSKRIATQRLAGKLRRMSEILDGRYVQETPVLEPPVPPDWILSSDCVMTSTQYDSFDVIPDEVDVLVAIGRPMDALQRMLARDWRDAVSESTLPRRTVEIARLAYGDAGLRLEFERAIASVRVEAGIGGRYGYITLFGVRRPVPLGQRGMKSVNGGPAALPASETELAATWRGIFERAMSKGRR